MTFDAEIENLLKLSRVVVFAQEDASYHLLTRLFRLSNQGQDHIQLAVVKFILDIRTAVIGLRRLLVLAVMVVHSHRTRDQYRIVHFQLCLYFLHMLEQNFQTVLRVENQAPM